MQSDTITQPLTLLKKIFGYDSFRPLQQNIIEAVLEKKDSLVVMPTGGGKSICYQIPALIFEGLTVVVSPLISLMKDQVDQMNQLGIDAVLLNSAISHDEYAKGISLIKDNKVRLLYAAPETLMKKDIVSLLASIRVDCIAIDEAHCISEWGHDFRPEYRMIAGFRKNFPDAVCMALTATATERVRDDIGRSLAFSGSADFIASFNRDNLFYRIISKSNPLQQTIDFLNEHQNESGIIYTFSRDSVDKIYASLKKLGYSILPYHAGLSDEMRMKNQELFLKDEVQIVVATIAFGMGIHKTNVRFVVHFDLPKSIESYYQETGRAGRDGVRSECLLLYSYSDIHKQRYFISQKQDDKEKETASAQLDALVRYAESESCRRIPLMHYFGESYHENSCGMCDNCINPPKNDDDLTIPAQMFLSCVKRCDEKYGAGYIIDVLRGSKSKKVLANNHNTLSTYGIGTGYSKEVWSVLSRQFIRKGLILQDSANFNVLRITDKGYAVLKGLERVMGSLALAETKKMVSGESARFDHRLFELLRQKRKELALVGNIPPYVVFSDKTLMEIASEYPQTEERLREVHGIGDHKIEKYGRVILELVSDFCSENNISGNAVSFEQKPVQKQHYLKTPRHIEIGEMYNEGRAVSSIAEMEGIKESTVISNLEKYVKEGNPIDPEGLLPSLPDDEQLIGKVLSLFDEHGPIYLKPVFESLNGTLDYDTLRIFRLYNMGRQ